MLRKFYSKPDYQTLTPVEGHPYHFVIADEEGKNSAEKLMAHISESSQCVLVADLKSTMLKDHRVLISFDALHEYLHEKLTGIPAGSQFYLFGRESFIWLVQSMLWQLYVPDSLCLAERCGPIERNVFCVHCREIITGVQHNQVSCNGCGCLLFVYDHFSKRHGCYMGFKVNAECEGEIAPAEVLSS